MKFWQLDSVCRGCSQSLEAVLREPKWVAYLELYEKLDELIKTQCRKELDRSVPDELVVAVLSRNEGKLYVYDGYVRGRPYGKNDHVVSYLDIYLRFGGTFLEDVLEYGMVKIPDEVAK